ncbi:hypothetical protein BJ165DRAFT_1511784 [Panaeolus papilionaceus]|nr:hypothetical protein BJ165DRAFT_1511784 [Panaeolus papilionaceus]
MPSTTDMDAQTEYLQCSEKVLTATEMTKLRGGIGVFAETWKSRQGQEWLVWKVVPGNRTEHYAEGVSKGSTLDDYEDIAIYRVHDLTHIRLQKDNERRGQVARNNPQQLSPWPFKKRDLHDTQSRKSSVPLNALVVGPVQKIMRDRLQKYRMKRKDYDTDALTLMESLEITGKSKKARITY